MYTIDEDQLLRDGKRFKQMYHPIEKVVVTPTEIYIICYPEKNGPSQYVHCIEHNGKEKWRLVDASLNSSGGKERGPAVLRSTESPNLPVRVESERRIIYCGRMIHKAGDKITWVMYRNGQIYCLTGSFAPGNVYCMNENGKLLWQAEPFNDPTPFDPSDPYCGYSSIFCRNGQPWAGAIAGYDCRLDPETGKIVEEVFTK